jgi:hypothetical protein
MGNIIPLAERAAAIGRPLSANSDIPYIGSMPEIDALGWLMGIGSMPLCVGRVLAVGVGRRGDMVTVLDTEDGAPRWYTGPARDWVGHDGPESAA